MLPPICEICDTRFDPFQDEGGLVTFLLTPEQEESNRRFSESGITGHPEGTYWFCRSHFPRALELQHLHSAEALKRLRALR